MTKALPGGWQDDVLARAEERLPRSVWRYVMATAGEGLTDRENAAAWRRVRLVPRVLRDVRSLELGVHLHGDDYRLPFGIAPTSLQRAADPEGELAMARAAAAAGVPHVVSSNAGHRFADIAAAGGPWWLQAYVTADRDDCLPMLEAAVAAGARAVVLTADLPFPGTKHDVGDDDFADVDLSWHRANYDGRARRTQRGEWAADLSAADIAWLGEQTGLPVVVKGVLHPVDAELCVDAGASAVWVSNHGGRQLDRAATTAALLPAVARCISGRVPLYVDGGVRGGADVLSALSLGADAVFLGRLPLLGLAAGGEELLRRILQTIESELSEYMRLAGARNTAETRDLSAEIGQFRL
ncbi:alpha-hydroxy-acid oxidizing protein [Nocardioides jiangxiensis]|uniref:Alpha-hydroxy-acid oxidizing protein n=1 Tax=Nocardioides jiangxiensis TaxID=3064524 RepID=A0ABT9B4F3_9ACTN|nr:alpha-hydroxy-acid oxidizing protein [Nocardioides sp. WY-20]MDO7869665.1 alpha-hydroxy-acid oxidizing protein [Nocardioides sp. WY-20]